MLGGIRELVPRRHVTLSLAVPAVVGALSIGLLLPQAAPRAHLTARRQLLPSALASPLRPSTSRLSPAYLRSLPHGSHATAGRPFYVTRPPARMSGLGGAAVPAIAVAAYENAARVLARSDRSCHLSWADLAAIGRVESDNGLTWGSAARVSPAGTLTPPILGPLLDGKDGFPAHPTPDHGRLEQGGRWERAVGPMQFLPSTWVEYGKGIVHDGVASPQNFWDAALAAGAYLCANGGDLAVRKDFDAAVLAYNHSRAYLGLVSAWERFYAAAGARRLAAATPSLLAVGISPLTKAQDKRLGEQAADRLVAGALAATTAKRSYAVTFSLVSEARGQTLLRGSGRLSTTGGAATLTIELPGLRPIKVLNAGARGGRYVLLPANLERRLGERPAAWLSYTPTLQAALPPRLRSDLSFVTAAGWSLEALKSFAATSGPTARLRRLRSGEGPYVGRVNLLAAAKRSPLTGHLLTTLALLAGARRVEVSAWTGQYGLIHRVDFLLPQLKGTSPSPVSLRLDLYGFGTALPLVVPAAAPFPPVPTTTTTTTTTARPTTTTRPPTTTSSTTTTTTTSPPTTTSSTTSTTTTTTTQPPQG